MINQDKYLKGRGAQINAHNHFSKNQYVKEHLEGLDEELLENGKTEYFKDSPKSIVNKVDSPDLGLSYSLNAYQGCEHGCLYCYARNSHQYWGFSGGLDFERKIIYKPTAPSLLKTFFNHPKWAPQPIMLSGNTDCYQPAERKFGITRKLLEVFLEYKNPVSIITKNSLILRDIDLLKKLSELNLLHVNVSLTTLNEPLRQTLEPRTATSLQRLKVIEMLAKEGISVNVMIAPIIPALNSDEIPAIIKAVADAGARSAHYTIVRLNGTIAEVFKDWIHKNYPERAEKVLNQIAECHGGKLNDSRFGTRMKGEGPTAKMIADLFTAASKKYLQDRAVDAYNYSIFKRPDDIQLSLFQ